MLTVLEIGCLVGLLIVIGLFIPIVRAEPTGCVAVFIGLILLVLAAALVMTA